MRALFVASLSSSILMSAYTISLLWTGTNTYGNLATCSLLPTYFTHRAGQAIFWLPPAGGREARGTPRDRLYRVARRRRDTLQRRKERSDTRVIFRIIVPWYRKLLSGELGAQGRSKGRQGCAAFIRLGTFGPVFFFCEEGGAPPPWGGCCPWRLLIERHARNSGARK